MFETFGFIVSFGPGEADDFGEEHFGELMAQREALGYFAAFAGEIDAAGAIDFDVAIASHALEGAK